MANAYTLVGGLGGTPYDGDNPIIPTTTNITIPTDTYFDTEVTIRGDVNLQPKNIKNGVNIFGVTGNAVAVSNVGGEGTAYIYDNGYTLYKITNVVYR